jgi:predicted P-loop ATPase
MHTFSIESSLTLIRVIMQSRTLDESETDLDNLINLLDRELIKIRKKSTNQNFPGHSENIQKVLDIGRVLFDGIDNVNSQDSLKEIAKRYLENSRQMDKFGPRVIKN